VELPDLRALLALLVLVMAVVGVVAGAVDQPFLFSTYRDAVVFLRVAKVARVIRVQVVVVALLAGQVVKALKITDVILELRDVLAGFNREAVVAPAVLAVLVA
jgi:hypothetical protein